ncbi:hypothetical protein FRC07_007915, partial [Ceratobasidium sp. 392]
MSDAPAPIFKRTKSRPNRARPPSPGPENDATKEESSPGAMSLMTKFKSKQKARAKLSFGQDEEGPEGMTPKRQESGRKSKLANPAAIRMPDSLEQASISTRTNSGPVYDKAYLDELKAATLSAPAAPTPGSQDVEMTLDIDEAEGAMVVENDLDAGDVFDRRPTEIPMSSAVLEAKKKRERMRVTGKPAPDDFISLSVARRDDMEVDQGPHPESRLMREEDDLGEGDDDDAEYTGAQERIALGKKGRKEAERQRKAGMIEMIEDVEEDDEETQAWELAQVRRGGNNNRTLVVEEKQIYKPHPIPAQTPVPTLDPAVARLTQALTKLATSHAGNTKSLTSLGDERTSLEQQEARLRELVTEAEEKRAWFNSFKEWMDSLADFLDEKFPRVEKIEEDFISLLTERAEMLTKRRHEDLGDDLSLFLGAPPDETEMEQVDDLGRALPSSSAPQSAVRRARRTARQSRRTKRTGASSHPDEGYSTDGSLGSDDERDFEVAVKRCRDRAVDVFTDVTSEEFRDPRKGVARWFGKWRSTWGESYQGAWGSLGVVGAWEMWCRLEICLWDPMVDRRSLDEFRWYSSLHDFSRPTNEAGESTEPTPDEDLVLSIVATAVIPRVAKLIQGGALDPYNSKHIRRLKDLAEQIEATVEADTTKISPLLGACIIPFRKAVDEAQAQVGPYLAPSQAPPPFDPESVPARARYLSKMSKLSANMLAWRKYTGE